MHVPLNWLSWTASWRPTGAALILIALAVGYGVFRIANGAAQQTNRKLLPILVLTVVNLSVVVCVWAIAAFANVDQPALATIAGIPPVAFLIPSAILLMLAFIKPFRSMLTLNTAALACALLGPMGFRLNLAVPAPPSPPLAVMSYDVDGWKNGADPVAAAITDAKPDVVCLQGATDDTASGQLERRLGGDYHFVHTGDLMIGSRHSISDEGDLALGDTGHSALQASVDVRGHDIKVVDVQLTPDIPAQGKVPAVSKSAERTAEAKALADAAQNWPRTTVVCADLSDQPLSGPGRTLTTSLTDAFDRAGWGFGYTAPANLPVTRPDDILVGPGIQVSSVGTVHATGSSHLPVDAQVSVIPLPPAPKKPADVRVHVAQATHGTTLTGTDKAAAHDDGKDE